MAVRQLRLGDEDTLRTLRLRALADSPGEFGSTYEREAGRTTEDWQRWFSPGATFVFDDPGTGAVGLVAAVPDGEDPSVVWLMAMWVDPAVRGTEAAGALVNTVLTWSKGRGATSVRLHMVEGNSPAKQLYERHGFRPSGRVERDGAVEIEMERELARETP